MSYNPFRRAFGSFRGFISSERRRTINHEASCEEAIDEGNKDEQQTVLAAITDRSQVKTVDGPSSDSYNWSGQIGDDYASESDDSSDDSKQEVTIYLDSTCSGGAAKNSQRDARRFNADTDAGGHRSMRVDNKPEFSTLPVLNCKSKRKAPEKDSACSLRAIELEQSPQPRKKVTRTIPSITSFEEHGDSHTDLSVTQMSTATFDQETSHSHPPCLNSTRTKKRTFMPDSNPSCTSWRREAKDRRMPSTSDSSEGSASNSGDLESPPSTPTREPQVLKTRITTFNIESSYDSPRQTRLTRAMRRWNIGSTRASVDHINISSHSSEAGVFRYLDLPQELQDIILGFCLEHDDTTSYPSYDYLIENQDVSDSESFTRGYRIWLKPYIKVRQFAVSRKFLKNAIRILGKSAAIEVLTSCMAQYTSRGLVPNNKPIRRFTHPRSGYRSNILQQILTDLLAASSKLRLEIRSAFMRQEILDQLLPLMPSLKQIDAYMSGQLTWIRSQGNRQPLYGYLCWQGLSNVGLRLRNQVFKVAVLGDEELKKLRDDKKLPEDLWYLFENDAGLNNYSTEIEKYNKTLLDNKSMLADPDDACEEAQYTKMSLSFNIETLFFEPKPGYDPYRVVIISVRFDGDEYSVEDVHVREHAKVRN